MRLSLAILSSSCFVGRAACRSVVVAALLVVVLPACSQDSGVGLGRGPAAEAAATVVAASATRGPIRVVGHYAGELRANAQAELAAEVSGVVRRVDVRLGDSVKKGQTLATIDQVVYQQRVAELQAAVQLAMASLEEADVRYRNLRAELKRKAPLLAEKLVTEREIEDLEAQVTAAKQQVEVARASVDQNRARLGTASTSLNDTHLRAPFDGTIAERYVDIGSHVSAAEPLFRLVDTTEIYVRLRLPERDAGLVRGGMPVTLRVDSMAGAELAGTVGRIAPAVDPATRTLRVDVLPAEGVSWAGLRPGMYARAEIVLAAEAETLVVPRQAVVKQRDGSYSVWRISAEGTADERVVRVGLQGPDQTQVLEGLSAGDRIVLRGQERLAAGMKVVLARDSQLAVEPPSGGTP